MRPSSFGGETITVWRIGVDHQTLVFFTIGLWRLHPNHHTLACQTIGIWSIPSDFGVTIGLLSPIALWSIIQIIYPLLHTLVGDSFTWGRLDVM